MNIKQITFYIGICISIISTCAYSQSKKNTNTKLILSENAAQTIAKEIETNSFLQASFSKVVTNADKALANGIELPIPKDPGGGYTHEKHKKNYTDMYNAALSYRVTKKTEYANYVKDMLLQYADLYPTLSLHPKRKENHPAGKLFWQGLNEAVWLFYTIQAYDLVKSEIKSKERKQIEKKLFNNVVEFISVDSYKTFNKIHNHGTWAVASVGMTGYVLGNKDMVERALKGSKKDGETGFFKQLEDLFSPDGYYSEGPYYQRYAMLPFIVFAEAIEVNQPELKIFEYKNEVLHKAVVTLLQLTNNDGKFYPFNDAIKDKTYLSEELVFATNIAYERYNDKSLLPVIKEQGKVSISDAGLKVAQALASNKVEGYQRSSQLIKDGPNGKQGGIALLRVPSNQEKQVSVLFKFASQGMGHGHFDRLGIIMYDEGREILQDYGAARFLNVEAKEGGRYLPENKTFAKQTIAHNTVTVDGISQFKASVKQASKSSAQLVYANLDNDDVQIVSAIENNAYNVQQQRTISILNIEGYEQPLVLDVFQIKSNQPHQYDLNYNYIGHLMETSFEYNRPQQLTALGEAYGYEHLYNLAQASAANGVSKLTFLNQNKFYTISTLTNKEDNLYLTEMGANDPYFNLRQDRGFIIRKNNTANATYVSVIEPHGNFNPQMETVQNPNSNLEDLELAYQDENYNAVRFTIKNHGTHLFVFSTKNNEKSNNVISINGKNYNWTGKHKLFKL
ncbi:Heparinase II/III-like protein [Mesonia phycicola]|uniref:Heparinase II/III-like protein n=1 Tax=Mesonia phycicola TaxID=579105 RepID=A0A1M6H0Y3_9FLAO|nr:alginate lyase family protein [Mesonia phycicola]SHJ15802.1 Heparinase II/III-like protein [Mesonia phycicola]